MKPRFSLLLLNWARPDNLKTIVDTEGNYDCIDEILVFNNNPNHRISAFHPKVRVINSNWDFGLRTRWILGALAKNEFLALQDDDILLPEEVFKKFGDELARDCERCYSLHGRNPDPTGQYNFKDQYGEVEIILTRAACLHKALIPYLLEEEYRLFGGAYPPAREFPGDDMFLSYCVTARYNKRPIAFQMASSNLPSNNALSAMPHYNEIRARVMRACKRHFDRTAGCGRNAGSSIPL